MTQIAMLLLCLGLAVCSGKGKIAPCYLESQAASPPKTDGSTVWKLAVVFRRQMDRRIYAGTAAQPELPSAISRIAPGRTEGNAAATPPFDYEIWLAMDGATLGLWYSPSQRLFGPLSASGQQTGRTQRDDGSLQRLVDSARPAVAQPVRQPDAVATGKYPPPPLTLSMLCRDADVIVVGRVAGILRNGHDPLNSSNMHQHTVYVVAVEDYLKTDTSGIPAIVKVRQQGGPLPWQEEILKEQGEGWQILDDPLLNVGDRYILFLRLPVNSDSNLRKLGYVPVTDNGITGKMGELDEYVAAHHWQGKILLREGFTRAPAEKGGDIHWRFERGPQILDIPEGEAIELIRRQLSLPSP